MSEHPLAMKDKLKAKKRPIKDCRIFVGDRDKYQKEVEESLANLINFLKDIQGNEEIPEPAMNVGKKLIEDLAKLQEPYYQKFVFRALNPVKFEKLMEEYPPPKGKETEVCDWEAFNRRIFQECLIEPSYDSLTEEEWEEFFDSCSHKEYELLMNTSMDVNIRNVDPTSPKDLMTPRSK